MPILFSLESNEPSEFLAIDGKEMKNIVQANNVLRDEYERLLSDHFRAHQQRLWANYWINRYTIPASSGYSVTSHCHSW